MKELEPVFLALSDATRLRIINLIGNGEVCVGDLVEVLGESQPKISRHLAYLRSSGLVSVRRDGKWIYYRLEEMSEPAAGIVDELLQWSATQQTWSLERAQLETLQHEAEKAAGRAKEKGSVNREKKVREQFPIEPVAKINYEEQGERAAEPPFHREEIETFLL